MRVAAVPAAQLAVELERADDALAAAVERGAQGAPQRLLGARLRAHCFAEKKAGRAGAAALLWKRCVVYEEKEKSGLDDLPSLVASLSFVNDRRAVVLEGSERLPHLNSFALYDLRRPRSFQRRTPSRRTDVELSDLSPSSKMAGGASAK
jgi:hypothetical protein